ncbi:MAG: mannosyltransferase [Aldersonia sp.]|nr:mannosyltransferase [Aldersonia sp.]
MSRLLRLAPLALALAVIARLLWMFLLPSGFNLVDLHVYVDGSATVSDGDLYDFTYSEVTPDFPLPFTYPPFAALVFYPLHFLPMPVVGVAWTLATVAALYAVVRISLTLVLGEERSAQPEWRAAALWWTAVGMWTEPVRTTLDYGQVNVFLVLGVMLAVRSARWWISGLLVGIVAGIKLTPAVTGLYFVARRRWATVLSSAVVFAATVGLSYLVAGAQAHEYFGTLLGDASRIGPVGSVWNQSLRGAVSRIVGYDVGTGALLLAAVAVVAVLAVLAWRALDGDDRLGTLVVVQLFGLMISPISWSHHWVWVIPMAIWLLHGPYGERLAARFVAGYWLVTTLIGVPWLLSFAQDSIWLVPRPAVLAWLGAVDAVGVLAFYLLLIGYGRVVSARTSDRRSAVPATRPSG